MPKVSIIIPNYNEHENLLRGVLDEVALYLKTAPFTYEVIISDDGSTDNSPEFIKDFVKSHKNFIFLNNKHGGKAAAVWAGINVSKGDIIIFSDMDQSTPLKEIEKLLPFYDQGYGVVFGSRGRMRNNFPIERQIMSWGFRQVRQIFLLRGIVDTQCGFKSMLRPIALEVFPRLQVIREPKNSKGWSVSAFDVELLFIAQKLGHKLKEVDVTWKDRDVAKGKGKNFLNESTDMLKQIMRVTFNDWKGKYN